MTSPLPNSLPSETITPMKIGTGADLLKPVVKALKKAGKNAAKKQGALMKERNDALKSQAEAKKVSRKTALDQFAKIQKIGDNYDTPSSARKDKPANFKTKTTIQTSEPVTSNTSRGKRVTAPEASPGEFNSSPRAPRRAQSSFSSNNSVQFKNL